MPVSKNTNGHKSQLQKKYNKAQKQILYTLAKLKWYPDSHMSELETFRLDKTKMIQLDILAYTYIDMLSLYAFCIIIGYNISS